MATKNPGYSKKRGKVHPKRKKGTNRKWSWVFSAGKVTKNNREKYVEAMRDWAQRNGVRIMRYGTHKGYLVAYLTTSKKQIPTKRIVRMVGRRGAKLKLVGVPITKKAAAGAYTGKYKRKKTTAKKTPRAKQVARKTATRQTTTKSGRKGTLKKGFFIGTGKNGNGYPKGKYYQSRK